MSMSVSEWSAFDEVCKNEKISKNNLLGLIEKSKQDKVSLTYSTRLFILSYFRHIASFKNKNRRYNLENIINSLQD